MIITTYCKQNLHELQQLLQGMEQEQYTKKLAVFSGSSLGQHVRHILEFYACIFDGIVEHKINYDNRKRELKIENNLSFSLGYIEKINAHLSEITTDVRVVVETNCSYMEDDAIIASSSLYRELLYCMEHSIHHQALLKIGLQELCLTHLIDENFGIAPATIRHKKVCVQ